MLGASRSETAGTVPSTLGGGGQGSCYQASCIRDGEVDFVAFRVGEGPPSECVFLTDDVATDGERGCDALVDLVVGQVDIDVSPVALWTRRVHLLERERRPSPKRAEQDYVVVNILISEHGAPERHHLGGDERIDRKLHLVKPRRLGCFHGPCRKRRRLRLEIGVAILCRRIDADRPVGPRGGSYGGTELSHRLSQRGRWTMRPLYDPWKPKQSST